EIVAVPPGDPILAHPPADGELDPIAAGRATGQLELVAPLDPGTGDPRGDQVAEHEAGGHVGAEPGRQAEVEGVDATESAVVEEVPPRDPEGRAPTDRQRQAPGQPRRRPGIRGQPMPGWPQELEGEAVADARQEPAAEDRRVVEAETR